jgi:hypothetical protein
MISLLCGIGGLARVAEIVLEMRSWNLIAKTGS